MIYTNKEIELSTKLGLASYFLYEMLIQITNNEEDAKKVLIESFDRYVNEVRKK